MQATGRLGWSEETALNCKQCKFSLLPLWVMVIKVNYINKHSWFYITILRLRRCLRATVGIRKRRLISKNTKYSEQFTNSEVAKKQFVNFMFGLACSLLFLTFLWKKTGSQIWIYKLSTRVEKYFFLLCVL